MARIGGRNGALYAAITSGGTAEPIAFLNRWNLTFDSSQIDVTAFGDTNTVNVAGLPVVGGSYGGWYDDATAQLYTAAVDGVARKFYLYPDRTTNTKYWYGTATFDFNIDVTHDGGVAINGDFSASSSVTKVG